MILSTQRNSASARGGLSEAGSDIIPNLDKKRSKGAFANKLGGIHFIPNNSFGRLKQ